MSSRAVARLQAHQFSHRASLGVSFDIMHTPVHKTPSGDVVYSQTRVIDCSLEEFFQRAIAWYESQGGSLLEFYIHDVSGKQVRFATRVVPYFIDDKVYAF